MTILKENICLFLLNETANRSEILLESSGRLNDRRNFLRRTASILTEHLPRKKAKIAKIKAIPMIVMTNTNTL